MESLIHKLKQHNVDVDVVDNQLKLNIPNNFDAQEIIKEIKENKVALISFIKKIKGTSDFKTIEPCPAKEFYVLSSAQKRLYFLQEFDKISVAYNMPQVAKIDKLNQGKIKETLNKLIARHESLRTCFVLVNGEPTQKNRRAS